MWNSVRPLRTAAFTQSLNEYIRSPADDFLDASNDAMRQGVLHSSITFQLPYKSFRHHRVVNETPTPNPTQLHPTPPNSTPNSTPYSTLLVPLPPKVLQLS